MIDMNGCYYPSCRGCSGWYKGVNETLMKSLYQKLTIKVNEYGQNEYYVTNPDGTERKLNYCSPILDQFDYKKSQEDK